MKKLGTLVVATMMMMVMATTAYAASSTFSATLPAKQGDTEVSTVARANVATKVKYFSIKVSSIDDGYDAVRAWTESSSGSNLSSATNQVAADGEWATISYSTVPAKGTNVVLNLDNPVSTTTTVKVSGTWSPN